MVKGNILHKDEAASVSSDTYLDTASPQAEEAILSWRNDPLYKYVVYSNNNRIFFF